MPPFPDEHGTATDGVVIDYEAFGTTGSALYPNDLGRTATHEIGHYFNLLHIWGDDVCGDDLVDDTPPQEAEHGGCPSFPDNAFNSCGSDMDGEMFMNYMDYSDDECLVMFTFDQADRMDAAIFGPRASLLNSLACQTSTAITKNPGDLSISLYPNPASDILTVKHNLSNFRFRVYNYIGVLIKQGFHSNTTTFDLNMNELSNGAYQLHLETGNNIIVRKFVVNK